MKNTRHIRCARGFSLVEIVLALGLSSVGLLSVVGLLGVSMKASQDAGDDSALTAMCTHVLAEMGRVPFDALALAEVRSCGTDESYPTLPDTLADSVFYFNNEGLQVQANDTGTNTPIYECRVRKTPDPSSRGVGAGVYNLVQLELHFSWPVPTGTTAAERSGQSRMYACLARY